MAKRDKEKRRAYNRAYRQKNLARIKQRAKEYNLKNKETIREKHRQYYLRDQKQRIAKSAKNYRARRDEIMAIKKQQHRADPRVAMLKAAQVRARKLKVLFDLALEDIIIPSHCPILGIPIVVGDGKRCNGSPSLDRINPKGFYTRINCRVISFKANTIKNDGTIRDHERVIAYMKGEL